MDELFEEEYGKKIMKLFSGSWILLQMTAVIQP